MTRAAGGPGVDAYPFGMEGAGCDYANATMRPILLQLAHNKYLSPTATYAGKRYRAGTSPEATTAVARRLVATPPSLTT